jgi:conjugative transfer region protein TrbK
MQLPTRLSAKAWARVVAAILVLLVLLMAAMSLRPRRTLAPQASVASPVDPLQAELVRCQGLGQAGASDGGCLKAWAESRRRFLGGPRP